MPIPAILALHAAFTGTPSVVIANHTVTTITGLENLAATGARGVNIRGEVVGVDGATESFPPCGQANEDNAFVDSKGKITKFAIFRGCYALARGVATDGTVVGYAAPRSNVIEGFIRSPSGKVTGVAYPGAYYTRFTGINPGGTIAVGNEYDGSFHGMIYKSGMLSAYNVPVSASGTSIEGVDDAGDMVGQYYGKTTKGFAIIGGAFITVSYPGSTNTVAYGIDIRQWVVGYYTDARGMSHGFARNPAGRYFSYDYPGASGTIIAGISDNGEVVGSYQQGGASYAYYATRN